MVSVSIKPTYEFLSGFAKTQKPCFCLSHNTTVNKSLTYLGLDTAQLEDNTSGSSKNTVSCWMGAPDCPMGKMGSWGTRLKAPAPRNTPLEVVRLWDLEEPNPEAGPAII